MSHTGPTLASKLILICFLATTYKARTEGGSFYATGKYGYARAAEIMNSKSSNDFRWCLKITSKRWISVGIASTMVGFKVYSEKSIKLEFGLLD